MSEQTVFDLCRGRQYLSDRAKSGLLRPAGLQATLGHLQEIRSLLTPESWIKGHLSQDEKGRWVVATDPQACRWCLAGAATRAVCGECHDTQKWVHSFAWLLLTTLLPVSPIDWNDWPSVTLEDVHQLLDTAIGLVQERLTPLEGQDAAHL